MAKNSQADRGKVSASFDLVRRYGREDDYQDALAWRRRMATGEATLTEQRQALLYFDKLAGAASAWRGIVLADRKRT